VVAADTGMRLAPVAHPDVAADEIATHRARAARAWLWSSVLLTGGAITAAIMLAPPAGASPVRALSFLLFIGSAVHVASTGWLFTVSEVRAYARENKARCLWVPALLIAMTAIAAGVISPVAFRWLLVPYFCWQFLHFCKQNIGMAALAASAQRVSSLLATERWPLLLAGGSAIVALAAQPRLLGLRLALGLHLRSVAVALVPLAAGGFAVAVVAGLFALARRPIAQRPPGFCVTYLTSLLFCLPVFVFASPYAAVGGMTVAHGLQYLLLVGLVAGNGSAAGRRPSRIVRLAALANIALIGGAALSASSHLHNAGPGGRAIFGVYLGIVMAHFAIDAGLWRMRDPLARQFLASSLPYLATRTSRPLPARRKA
jgi:hypothetical protein